MLERQGRRAARFAWSLYALTMLLFLSSLALRAIDSAVPRNPFFLVAGVGLYVAYPVAGTLIASRQPRNPVGWLLCVTGLVMVVADLAGEYALRGLIVVPGSLPGALAMAWLQSWLPFVWFPAMVIALFVLFPDGRPPSRAWWIVVGMAIVASITQIAIAMLTPKPLTSMNGIRAVLSPVNPTGVGSPAVINTLQAVGGIIVMAGLGAGAALIVRLRRASGDEREQIKWLVYLASLIIAVLLVATVLIRLAPGVAVIDFYVWVSLVIFGIPVAMGIAILKYRLYNIDLIINKSLVYGTLAGFIGAVYVAIVVGLGALIETRGQPSLPLSILATAIVAVAFQPVREMVERLANRLVYGKRATPYEVLSRFTERVGGIYASEEILPRMAQLLAEGTSADRAQVWLRLGDAISPAASWPEPDGQVATSVPLSGQHLPPIPTVSRVVAVRHQGELLGALSINKRPGEALTPIEADLLKDLAAQAGLVLRNVRLTAELRARLDEISKQAGELRASRQRIVAAQDAERHRLERNIHDGAQQNLVALTVKLRLAASLAKRDPQGVRDSVKDLIAESGQALQTLRALAQGIYPPLLRDHGLVAALRGETWKMPVTVTVAAVGLNRYPPDVEAAVYFVCLEALQNVTKHAGASRAIIKLSSGTHALSFEITDDGSGFVVARERKGSGLRNMADRIEAIGGRLDIQSSGQGTTVRGTVPVRAMEAIA